MSSFKKEMKGIYCSCIGKETLDEAPFAYRNMEMIREAVRIRWILRRYFIRFITLRLVTIIKKYFGMTNVSSHIHILELTDGNKTEEQYKTWMMKNGKKQ